jgi:hypothetical protein
LYSAARYHRRKPPNNEAARSPEENLLKRLLLRALVRPATVVVLALVAAVATLAPAVEAQEAEIFDPTGDSSAPDGSTDLTSARVSVEGADLRLEVRFAPGAIDDGDSTVQFALDTDHNPSTGSPGTDNQCGPPDNALLGVDYLIELRAFSDTVRILRATGGCNAFVVVPNALVPDEQLDAMSLEVALAVLGGDDGRLAFKAAVYTQNAQGSSPIRDRITDPGLPPGIVGAPPHLAPCVRDEQTACLLDGRFEVTVKMWSFATPPVLRPGVIQTYAGVSSETDRSVSFYSFEEGNGEIFVKMVDGCDHPTLVAFWLFAAGATNAETEVRVRDTDTGELRSVHNPRGRLFETVADTAAFETCQAGG